jgi:hypothetical protein
MLALIEIVNCAIVCAESDEMVQPTRGKYMGQSWHIDADHLLWWQGKPYVRYGFTGNGNVHKFMKLGFNHFNVGPSEELWVFSKDPSMNRQALREVNDFTDELVHKGATYYAILNLLWPWRGSGKIAEQDRVNCLFRKTWDVTEFAKQDEAIELEFISYFPLAVNRQKLEAYLFDLDAGQYRDISKNLRDFHITMKTIEESAHERYRATVQKLKFVPMRLPDSDQLRITIIGRT